MPAAERVKCTFLLQKSKLNDRLSHLKHSHSSTRATGMLLACSSRYGNNWYWSPIIRCRVLVLTFVLVSFVPRHESPFWQLGYRIRACLESCLVDAPAAALSSLDFSSLHAEWVCVGSRLTLHVPVVLGRAHPALRHVPVWWCTLRHAPICISCVLAPFTFTVFAHH